MRGLIILFIATVALGAPQGNMRLMDEQEHLLPNVGPSTIEEYNIMSLLSSEQTEPKKDLGEVIQQLDSDNTIQQLPEIQQKEKFSAELPHSQELPLSFEEPRSLNAQVHSTHEERVPVPFVTYGLPRLNEVVVTKQFFIHSAPEEDEEVEERIVNVGQSRKNYNVVFIRAPVAARRTSSIKIIPALNEDKTIVYVLSKKSEADDIRTKVEEAPATNTKPEVHFIKYKTQDEAKHAQEKIQAEYELLGGSTEVSNEGVSPVSSVVGSLDVEKNVNKEATKTTPTIAMADKSSMEDPIQKPTSNEYLPPIYYYRN